MKIEHICSYSPQYNLLQEDVTAYDGEAESTTVGAESITTRETCADDSDRQPWQQRQRQFNLMAFHSQIKTGHNLRRNQPLSVRLKIQEKTLRMT